MGEDSVLLTDAEIFGFVKQQAAAEEEAGESPEVPS